MFFLTSAPRDKSARVSRCARTFDQSVDSSFRVHSARLLKLLEKEIAQDN